MRSIVGVRILGFIALASLTSTSSGFAESGYCPRSMEIRAEYEYTRVHTWAALHKSFVVYHGCDNGGVAEGYDDAVNHLLVRQWDALASVKVEILRDKAFASFVLRHINEEWDLNDLKRVRSLASKHCPKNLDQFCRDVVTDIDQSISQH